MTEFRNSETLGRSPVMSANYIRLTFLICLSESVTIRWSAQNILIVI